jgi:formyltetrahydrofolate hydrolase
VHFVDEEYDRGAILAQRVVPVYPTDTPKKVAARVLKEVSRGGVLSREIDSDRIWSNTRILPQNLPHMSKTVYRTASITSRSKFGR